MNPERIFFSFEPSDASRAAVVLKRARQVCSQAELLTPPVACRESTETSANAVEKSTVAESTIIVLLVGQADRLGPAGARALTQGIAAGKRMVAIDVSRIKTLKPDSTLRPAGLPDALCCYFWLRDEGYLWLDRWIHRAAIVADADPSRQIP